MSLLLCASTNATVDCFGSALSTPSSTAYSASSCDFVSASDGRATSTSPASLSSRSAISFSPSASARTSFSSPSAFCPGLSTIKACTPFSIDPVTFRAFRPHYCCLSTGACCCCSDFRAEQGPISDAGSRPATPTTSRFQHYCAECKAACEAGQKPNEEYRRLLVQAREQAGLLSAVSAISRMQTPAPEAAAGDNGAAPSPPSTSGIATPSSSVSSASSTVVAPTTARAVTPPRNVCPVGAVQAALANLESRGIFPRGAVTSPAGRRAADLSSRPLTVQQDRAGASGPVAPAVSGVAIRPAARPSTPLQASAPPSLPTASTRGSPLTRRPPLPAAAVPWRAAGGAVPSRAAIAVCPPAAPPVAGTVSTTARTPAPAASLPLGAMIAELTEMIAAPVSEEVRSLAARVAPPPPPALVTVLPHAVTAATTAPAAPAKEVDLVTSEPFVYQGPKAACGAGCEETAEAEAGTGGTGSSTGAVSVQEGKLRSVQQQLEDACSGLCCPVCLGDFGSYQLKQSDKAKAKADVHGEDDSEDDDCRPTTLTGCAHSICQRCALLLVKAKKGSGVAALPPVPPTVSEQAASASALSAGLPASGVSMRGPRTNPLQASIARAAAAAGASRLRGAAATGTAAPARSSSTSGVTARRASPSPSTAAVTPPPVSTPSKKAEDKEHHFYFVRPTLQCPCCRGKNYLCFNEERAEKRWLTSDEDSGSSATDLFVKLRKDVAFPINKDLESTAAALLRMKKTMEEALVAVVQ